jgi:hypothetical protein
VATYNRNAEAISAITFTGTNAADIIALAGVDATVTIPALRITQDGVTFTLGVGEVFTKKVDLTVSMMTAAALAADYTAE